MQRFEWSLIDTNSSGYSDFFVVTLRKHLLLKQMIALSWLPVFPLKLSLLSCFF